MRTQRAKQTSVEDTRQEQGLSWQWLALRLIGAGLLVATGAIHLDLYLTGYRTIPTIGWLFLLQVISAFGLGAVILVSDNRLAAAGGAGFALATLGGYLLSLRMGLFGFREVRTTAGIVAAVIELAAFAALSAVALRPSEQHQPERSATESNQFDKLQSAIPAARWAAATVLVLAAVLLGVSLAATPPSSTSPPSSRALLKIANIHGVSVLTNERDYTLYWFVPDTPTKSACYGTCAVYWPPVIGNPAAGLGVTGMLGTIRRSNGITQVTFDNHPLYSYFGDSAPGQAIGNNIYLNGGLWHEITVSG